MIFGSNQNKKINEQKLYKLLRKNPELKTNSVDLTNFYDNNLNSNKEKIASTEEKISEGNLNEATVTIADAGTPTKWYACICKC